MQTIKIKMTENCEDLWPKKAHHDDAAYDLCARLDMTLPVRKSVAVPTGVALELPYNYEAQIRPRSGLALKHDIMLTNSPGTIDAGFRGEINVIIYNGGEKPYPIKRGDRVAQMVIAKLAEVTLVASDELNTTERGDKGYGSSGISEKLG